MSVSQNRQNKADLEKFGLKGQIFVSLLRHTLSYFGLQTDLISTDVKQPTSGIIWACGKCRAIGEILQKKNIQITFSNFIHEFLSSLM